MANPDPTPTAPGNPPPAGPPPGYPTYPQGGYYPYPYPPGAPGYTAPPNAPAGYPNALYGAPYPYPYQPGYPVLAAPPQPPRDTYRLVIGIIAMVCLSLTIIGGLFALLALGLASLTGITDSLYFISNYLFVALAATAGGGVGMYFTIRALMGRPSAQVRLPSYLVPAALTVVVLGVGIAQFNLGLPQAQAFLEAPLLLLLGIFPAVAIFSFAAERLGYPTTWRRVWLAYLSGTFLATLLAGILELIAAGAISTWLNADAGNVTQINTSNSSQLIAVLLVLSVVAPLAEEGLKPLGPLAIIGRIRGPAEAFLLGMAAGVGFAILETIGYIGQGSADWVIVATERVGAALLHSVGAGMATLGWYYLFRGKGVANRYLKGIGAILYAILQHGLFNGANFLALIPGPVGNALNTPVWFFGLPVQGDTYLFLAIYAGIATVLVVVTGRLRQSAAPPTNLVPTTNVPPLPAMVPQGGMR